MNQTVEKWLIVAALAGWLASLGSLVGLAIRAASPAVASRPSPAMSLYSQNRNLPLKTQTLPPIQEVAMTRIPADTSKGYWAESLQERSSSSTRWTGQRSP
ncbi:hypothetical protein [Leptolyngbya sp. NIES-2104]|uniref:hypothetical protein n=1 Tax=Leptolyngbya sp. NIES-2104 TaxID=1552121 RepID=UPI0006ECBC24|nr:hypothetical protein [Leptolyngbya sp. NIES-2104]GAP97352.1 hypothetical protein NIES2104_38990 [Leptolyngbya sp. NIES-2104]